MTQADPFREKISQLTEPVIDRGGQVAGLLTVGRIIRYLASAYPAEVVDLPPEPNRVSEEAEGA